jgi:hypothetical protein
MVYICTPVVLETYNCDGCFNECDAKTKDKRKECVHKNNAYELIESSVIS